MSDAKAEISLDLDKMEVDKTAQLNFFKKAVADFKKQAEEEKISDGNSLYQFTPPPKIQPQEKSAILLESKGNANVESLPPEDCQIAQATIQHAEKFHKRGYSELSNNGCPQEERELIVELLDTTRKASAAAAEKMRDSLTEAIPDDSWLAATYGCEMHCDIAAAKYTGLTNCDERALLALDYLYSIGFDQPACTAFITTGEERNGHTFVMIGHPGKQQIWDPWGNVAFPYTPENMEKYLKCWREKSASGPDYNELEDFDPSKHELTISDDRTLENLRLFRQIAYSASLAKQIEPQEAHSAVPESEQAEPLEQEVSLPESDACDPSYALLADPKPTAEPNKAKFFQPPRSVPPMAAPNPMESPVMSSGLM